MANNSTENLIQSDSSTSTDELNNGSHNSRSMETVSKKMFHKKKTAFVSGGANSGTSPSSSVTSSPQQHPIIVVGTADVHQQPVRLSPPKPLPRKRMMVDSMATNRKQFPKVVDDDIIEMSVSGDSESHNSEEKKNVTNREVIELVELKSPSGSSAAHSDKTEEPKMFFARSRKNTIVTNIDEVSTQSSVRTNKSSRTESKSLKPLPKPRQLIQPQYEIVHEKSLKKPEMGSSIKLSNSVQSKSIDSGSETFSESETGSSKKDEVINKKSEGQMDLEKTREDYRIERFVGIYIHHSSELKFDYSIHRPIVRCSIIDTTTGQLLQYRNANRKNQIQAPDTQNTIQPVTTKGCRFMSSRIFQCNWEQLLMINENITQLMQENIIIFFEILDTPSVELQSFFSKFSRPTDEWNYLCWGFLKLGDGINSSNLDKRSRLQLFRYQRRHLLRKCSMNIFDQFRFNRIKYPATLIVTVKGITPTEKRFDFPSEKCDKILSVASDKIKSESQKPFKFTDTENTSSAPSHFLRRLPGQICKHPNTVHKTHLQPSSKGCLVSKFSPNGQFLAYSFSADYNIQIATVPDLKVINTLRGHTNFVYDLDWLADKRKNSFPLHLVSASSDRMAIVWTIEKDKISLTILPHPSFLYAAKFLVNLSVDECCLFAVTGGRDCAIRVWKIASDHNFDLLQESMDHENYITSIACSTKTSTFYSSDWNGYILEWSNQGSSNNFQVMRKFPKMSDAILSLQLHPKNEQRLYAQLKTHQINCFDTTNEIVLSSLGATDDGRNVNSKFTVSPCGSTVYTIHWDTIHMYNILTGSLQNSLTVPFVKHQRNAFISHLDYHPKLFLLSAALYGIDAGIVLLSHKSEANSMDGQAVHQDSFDDKWMLLKSNVNPRSSELLGNIIQRIDDILHQPHPNQNETDDFKNKSLSANLNRTEDIGTDLNRTQDSDHEAGAVAYVEVGSLNLVSESDSDVESGGTFTIRNRSVSDVSNRTFTLNKNVPAADGTNAVQPVNDGTYSIEAENNSDDTTISESM